MATINVSTSQNITDICATANPGDVILLASGIHSVEQVYIGLASSCKNGTVNAPITLKSADPSNPAVLNSTVTNRYAASGTKQQLIVEDISYWNIENINIENFINAGVLVHARNSSTSNIKFNNVTLRDSTQSASSAARTNHSQLGSHPFLIFGSWLSPSATISNCTFTNVKLINVRSGDPVDYQECFTVAGRAHDILIEGCEVRQSGYGIAFNVLGVGAYDTNNGVVRYVGQPNKVTFRRCKVIDYISSNWACTAFYTDRAGNWAGENIVIEECFVRNVRTFVSVSHEPAFGPGTVASENIYIRNNVAIVGKSGIYGSGGCVGFLPGTHNAYEPMPKNIRFYNNVLILNNPSAYSFFVKWQRAYSAEIHNNIFYERNNISGENNGIVTWATADSNNVAWPSGTAPVSTYLNMFCNSYSSDNANIATSRSFELPGNALRTGLTSWKANTRFEANSITTVPQFANYGTENIEDYVTTNDPGLSCGKLGIDLDNVTPPTPQPTTVTAIAGADQTKVDEDDNGSETFTLNASGSSTTATSITSYAWTANNVSIPDTEITSASFPVGLHTVTLTVTDSDNNSASDTLVVTVLPAPTGNACDSSLVTNGTFSNTFSDWTTISN